MPIQHTYRLKHLALTIALAVGCAEFTMAEDVLAESSPLPAATPEELMAQLDAFIGAADTLTKKVEKAADWTALALDGRDDLISVQTRGSFRKALDGGAGVNVLQLDAARGGSVAETRNFTGLEVKQGDWTVGSTGDFDLGALVRPEATLLNNGHINGEAITQGTLINNGSIGGRVYVDEMGSFSGKGRVGALNVNGELVVNRLHGAPLVTGNMTLSNTATLAYEVHADGRAETIKVDGTARLGDATLKIVPVGDFTQTRQYTVIEAGKVEGAFAKIENSLAFMTPSLQYEEKTVGLTYARNGVTIEEVAIDENGRELGRSIERTAQTPFTTGNAAIDALLGADLETAEVAIDQLTGYATANLAKLTLNSDAPIGASMLSAMRQLDSANSKYRGRNAAPRLAAGNEDNGRVWLQALGHSGKLDRNFDALQHSTTGLLMGADWGIDEQWRLGLMGGKSQTRLDGSLLDGGLDSWHLGAYALRQNGPMSLRLGATHSSHDGSTKRQIAFNGFRDRPKGKYDANTQQVFAEAGYNLGRDVYSIEPFASVGYQRYQRGSYTEKGGDAALHVQGQTRSNLNSTLGLRMAKVNTLDNGMQLTPRFSAGWKHTYGELESSTRQKLATEDRLYTVEGAALDRNSVTLDAGLDLSLSKRQTLGVGVIGEIGTDSRNHGITGQWRMTF